MSSPFRRPPSSHGLGDYIRPTEMSTLLSGTHGRQRRQERNIEKIDLKRARRYGMMEVQENGRYRYTYGGIRFIYDPETNQEVTSHESPEETGEFTGTKFAPPVILDKYAWSDEWSETFEKQFHDMSKEQALADHSTKSSSSGTAAGRSNSGSAVRKKAAYTSHSVLVVDMSGSMKRDDVNGARCRSDAVWLALARDYVKVPLERGERSERDLVSIVIMRDDAQVMYAYEPTTWVLFNKLIDLREWRHLKPAGHGNYCPAIRKAEELFEANNHAGCALSLLFFSDGRPSDRDTDYLERIGSLASKFGRRISISCIAMADMDRDFSALNNMVTEAQSYGAPATFGKPSFGVDSISHIISSLATSLTTSKTEMTNINTGSSKEVRMDVTREKHDTPDSVGTWTHYRSTDPNCFVRRIWTWRHRGGLDFVQLVDPRCSNCYSYVGYQSNINKGIVCHVCEGFALCHSCNSGPQILQDHHRRVGHRQSKCDALLSKMRLGKLQRKELPSFSIAVKNEIFGEGAERIVRKVHFIDERGYYIGTPMVAKESRFVDNEDNYEQSMMYHRDFMRTQNIANDFALKFNAALDDLKNHFDVRYHNWIKKLPRIHFIEPMVVEVMQNGQERNILVEKLLQGEYRKFNNNMGYVEKAAREDQELSQTSSSATNDLVGQMNNLALEAIGEEVSDGDYDDESSNVGRSSDEEDEAGDEIVANFVRKDEADIDDLLDDVETSAPGSGSYRDVKDSHFPQAFSHYTYEKSKKHFMVVDLQGVISMNLDGTKYFELTDPVIHKHRKKNKEKYSTWTFGRTDRGETGMKAFFKSHKCSDVCRLLGLTEVDV